MQERGSAHQRGDQLVADLRHRHVERRARWRAEEERVADDVAGNRNRRGLWPIGRLGDRADGFSALVPPGKRGRVCDDLDRPAITDQIYGSLEPERVTSRYQPVASGLGRQSAVANEDLDDGA